MGGPPHDSCVIMREIFEHTADLGIRIRSETLDGLFSDAASGFTEVLAGDLGQIEPRTLRTFTLQGADAAELLVDWLGELLFTFETERLLFCEFAVCVRAHGLAATAWGEPYDPARHRLAHEIKAITRHAFSLQRTPEGWEATLILDI